MKAPRPAGQESRFSSLDEFVIKVCGITSIEDALLSAELGANALGFNFYPKSPRFIDPESVAPIVKRLPENVLKVGLVVFGPEAKGSYPANGQVKSEFLQLLNEKGINAYQFHGLKKISEVPAVNGRILIATSPKLANYFSRYQVIIDTSWGSGTLADWDLVSRTVRCPYILSGGLSSENIEEALATLRPAGVDVCSGVEKAPGKKDPDKLRRFLGAVRAYVSRSDN